MEILNFIGGEFIPAEGHVVFEKVSPFDGSILAQVANSNALDVIKALQMAKKSSTIWSATSWEDRAQVLQKIADCLEKRVEEVSYQEALHQGLPKQFVEINNVRVAIQIFRDHAQKLSQSEKNPNHSKPTGVIGIMTSWAFSLRLVAERLAPALAAGNVCLVKVSEQSPITGQILGEIFREIELPTGVVGVIQGGSEVSKILAAHPSVRAVTAAGRTSTIESIGKAALPLFKKVQLSGSAKNSCVVLADTDYKSQMPEIMQSFLIGQGQLCWNSSRIFIPEAMASDFVEAMKQYLSTLRMSTSPHDTSPWTPLISAMAVDHIDEKKQFALRERGKVIFGGQRPEGLGFHYEPTVFLDLPNCSVLQQDELFGPLLLVTPVKYQHEAVKWANTSYLGHSAIVWGSQEKALKVAEQIECAQVSLNSWILNGPNPILGTKHSSFGNLDMSWAGSFYSEVKTIQF